LAVAVGATESDGALFSTIPSPLPRFDPAPLRLGAAAPKIAIIP
jgi:hypothetical protein